MNETILIVDDNEDVARVTTSILKAKGYQVESASDGPRALAHVAEKPPDCILLDITMPQMSGLEVLAQLKGNPATAGIPVILVTARHRDDDVLDGYKEGAEYYVTKPFSSQELLYGVRLVLGDDAPAAKP